LKLVLGSQALMATPSAGPKQPVEPPVAVDRSGAEINGRPTVELLERLVGSLEQLDGRIRKLEQIRAPVENPVAFSHTPEAPVAANQPRPTPTSPGAEDEAAKLRLGRALRIRRLLANGEALLIAENAKRALECFEEALVLEPGSVEAQIKKGNALERLGRLEEALGAYDHAIAVDSTATMAYLFKGGVCNRLDRYEEALQCYKQALGAKPAQSPR